MGREQEQRLEDIKRIRMLEDKLEMCKDDVESERREKERALSKIVELEQELRIVHRQVSVCIHKVNTIIILHLV